MRLRGTKIGLRVINFDDHTLYILSNPIKTKIVFRGFQVDATQVNEMPVNNLMMKIERQAVAKLRFSNLPNVSEQGSADFLDLVENSPVYFD